MDVLSAVVFDLDGTLIDSAPDIQVALNKLLADGGRPELSLRAVTAMIGDGAAKLVERAWDATGGVDGADIGQLTQGFLAHYDGHTADLTRPYPGVAETLAHLRETGLRLGVCTNKPEKPTREVLGAFDLEGYFTAIVGGDTCPGVRKPDPQVMFAMLDALGVRAGEAVMVGDNTNDVAVARAAGMKVVVRAGGYTAVPASELGADLVIEAFSALPEALRHLAPGFTAAQAG